MKKQVAREGAKLQLGRLIRNDAWKTYAIRKEGIQCRKKMEEKHGGENE